jgi:outer membrane protein assembly factor BamB
MIYVKTACLGLMAFVGLSAARADDWPQFLGLERDGTSHETGFTLAWGKVGPRRLWDRDVGEGYRGPVVAGDDLILFHRLGGMEVVDCLRAADGKAVWKFSHATQYRDMLNKGDGPRSTPVITDKYVIALGAEGWLHCLDRKTGTKVWSRSLNEAYRVPASYFGVGTSPLVVDNLVLVNVGGQGAGIVAFDLLTGKEAWRATNDGASYASPTLATAGGTRHAVFFTREGVVLLDPRTGKQRFHMRWRARYQASVNAATPIVVGDRAFISASYETGALLLRLTSDRARVLWQNDESMSNHYNTCVHFKGHLYGFHGRQESVPSFRCIELETGKVRWEQKEFGCGSMILAQGSLIVLLESGELLTVDATPQGFHERARAQALKNGPCRAQIALAHGRLYARDQAKLVCWNLRK